MKKWIIAILTAALLTGCAEAPTASSSQALSEVSSTVQSEVEPESAAESESSAESVSGQDSSAASEQEPLQEESAENKNSTESVSEPVHESTSEPEAQSESTAVPVPEEAPAPEVQPEPAPEPEPAPVQPTLAYGELPLHLAAGTDEWWGIDSTDSAYQACVDNINAIRAAGGVAALSINSNLSAAADARCESFVEGGPFDHSGMTTVSEICAKGPLRSAQEVCAAWQASEAHYSNIMNPNFTQMGVGCWFCSTA